MESGTAISPCVILLNSFPGIGKLTTAAALRDSLPAASSRLIDNHKWLDPAYSIHPCRQDIEYTDIGNAFRRLLFSKLKEISDKNISIIVTNVITMEAPNDVEAFAEQVDIARVRGCKFLLVTLGCDGEENGNRLGGRDVGTMTKLKRPEILEAMRATSTILDPKSDLVKDLVKGVDFQYLEIDTTGRTVEESVKKILEVLRQDGEGC